MPSASVPAPGVSLKKPIAMSKETKKSIYETGAATCNVIAVIIRMIKYPLDLMCEGLEAMACQSDNYAHDIRRKLDNDVEGFGIDL